MIEQIKILFILRLHELMLQPLERPRIYRTFFRWLLEHTPRHHVDESANIDLLQLLEGLLNLIYEVLKTKYIILNKT